MKKLALLLAILLCIPTISLMSCTKDDGEKVQGDNDKEIITELDPDNRLATTYSPNIPQGVRFDGETFNFLVGSVGMNMIYAEEENSDLVNDAVYRRNHFVAEHFGINIEAVNRGFGEDGEDQRAATQLFRSLIESNDSTYHAFIHVQHSGMPQMMLEEYFVDWNTIPYVNLEDEWWHQNLADELCYGDKIYVMTGDYTGYISRINCLVFNKDIFDEMGLEYPYQDVLDGTWTFDKFTELLKKGAKDLNGDGLMTLKDDQWGLVGWVYEMGQAFLVSTGFSPLERDADNMPILNQNTDKTHEIYEKIVNIFKDGQYAIAEETDYSAQFNAFVEGRAMFRDTFLGTITQLSDTEFDFGVIPYPKWDENTDYMNRSANMSPLTYIPVTNPNIEMTGAVLEELAYQSAKELTPIYFDTVLTVKSTRDVESEAMLPIIKNNARFVEGEYHPNIVPIIRAKSNNYASAYASNLSIYQETLEEMRNLLID